LAATIVCFAISCRQQVKKEATEVKTDTINAIKPIVIQTSDDAIKELKAGNERFVEGKPINTNYKERIEQTKAGQKPHSIILSCMDSRVPPK
jgi:hypothetical protein